MRSYINTCQKCIEVWLTHEEPSPEQKTLDALRAGYPGYLLVTFRSGTQDLVSATLPLLRENLQA